MLFGLFDFLINVVRGLVHAVQNIMLFVLDLTTGFRRELTDERYDVFKFSFRINAVEHELNGLEKRVRRMESIGDALERVLDADDEEGET